MIDINCTVIVQAIHFGIAYVVLRVLLFRPTISCIQQAEHHQHQLLDSIEANRAALVAKQQEKDQKWVAFQYRIKALIPVKSVEQEIHHMTMPTISYPSITKAEVTQIKHDVATALVQKVNNVW